MDVEEMLERLGAVIGPPPEGGVAPVPWEIAPEVMDFQLPADYRAFVDRYGSISIRDELHVFAPSLVPTSKTGQPLGFEGPALHDGALRVLCLAGRVLPGRGLQGVPVSAVPGRGRAAEVGQQLQLRPVLLADAGP
ncbi:hypothetical protein [Kitasatospora fiedleri]|uniref:hypothetical protein n=1 Tax=Kitasatospora fiedleri TaxID=2991545 RepID=UPI002499B426|nr:hypothetical protein [Kitasatospora fiedleri]